MKATLEHIARDPRTYVLRVHPDDNASLGDPYIAAGTVTVDHREVATVQGFASSKYSREVRDACTGAFSAAGFRRAQWARIHGGRVRWIKVVVP